MGIESLTPWGAVINAAVGIIDKLIPDPVAKAKAQLDLMTLQQNGELKALESATQLALAQSQVNAVEAASPSLFKSGWRPAVGWICAGGLGYQFLFAPLFTWITANTVHWTAAPTLDIDTLMTLLFGMLGLGAYRSVEKVKGVA